MKQMKIFENKEFGSIRVIEDGDKCLFCGSDVAKALMMPFLAIVGLP